MLNTDIRKMFYGLMISSNLSGAKLWRCVLVSAENVWLRLKMRVICFTHNTDAGSSEILPGMTPNFKHICKLVVNCLKLWVVTRCKFMTMTKSRLECTSQDACVLWEFCQGLGHLIICIQASKIQHAKLDICIEPFCCHLTIWFILFHIVSIGCCSLGWNDEIRPN